MDSFRNLHRAGPHFPNLSRRDLTWNQKGSITIKWITTSEVWCAVSNGKWSCNRRSVFLYQTNEIRLVPFGSTGEGDGSLHSVFDRKIWANERLLRLDRITKRVTIRMVWFRGRMEDYCPSSRMMYVPNEQSFKDLEILSASPQCGITQHRWTFVRFSAFHCH